MTDEEFLDGILSGGGPAFPATIKMPGGGTFSGHGMTMRQWYAGQVLPVLIAEAELTYRQAAADSFVIADAMIEAEQVKP